MRLSSFMPLPTVEIDYELCTYSQKTEAQKKFSQSLLVIDWNYVYDFKNVCRNDLNNFLYTFEWMLKWWKHVFIYITLLKIFSFDFKSNVFKIIEILN